ncbi:AAA family ATPase [Bacillus sp. T33-2]|uniref:AAA family ATPase n=1 Tax=Bacillus sp. T33-2 TaxID=2054168 RepID=UPI000C76162B|nr:AAA family ATPase [Bacillus sp. T33-2]PLR95769.1 AAA family ATPase [Bacillus sp. T33-2]
MPFINDQLRANEEQLLRKQSFASRFTFKTEDVMHHLTSSIFGQDHVLQHIENMLHIVKADIGDPYRPLYVALFLGPTGVGKTETVRSVAKAIHGDPELFCRVDMNTLSQEHYAASLTGAPPGYVGSKEGSSIFQEDLIEGSFSKPGIVLFDELEKASEPVIQALLNVFDTGTLILTSGEQKIDFRNTLIFMTSNIGSREMGNFANNSLNNKLKKLLYRTKPANWRMKEDVMISHVIKQSMEKSFPPEFINRIDDVLTFQWLKRDVMEEILNAQLELLNERLKKKQYQLEVNEEARRFLIEKGYDQKYGARSLKRSIRKHLELPVALAMRTQSTGKLRASVQGNEIAVNRQEGMINDV